MRGYIDIAHALLRHFEEALGTKQRLTAGSLQCAETVCKALRGIQEANPRLSLLVERISAAIALLHKRKLSDEQDAVARDMFYEAMVGEHYRAYLDPHGHRGPQVLQSQRAPEDHGSC